MSGQFVQDRFIAQNDGNRIEEVVVFKDRAYVKRRAQVAAARGINRVLMEILALEPDPDSIQAAVRGDGELLSVQYREIPVRESPRQDVQTLEKKRKQLVHKKSALLGERAVKEKQTVFLDSVLGFADTEIPKSLKTQFPDTEDLENLLGFLGENYQQIGAQARDLDKRVEVLEEEIAVLDRALTLLRHPETAIRRVVEVLFDARKDQEIGIEAAYVTENASWEPVYKVDVSPDLSGLSMTLFARIRQQTGEAWADIRLSVSKAVPVSGAALPDPESWHLSLPSSVPPIAIAGKARISKAHTDTDYDLEEPDEAGASPPFAASDAPVTEAGFRQAAERELPLAFEYELPQRIHMPSGDSETLLPLHTRKPEGEFFFYTVPREDPLPYLVCRVVADSRLLAGRVNVHFGGRFVGSTALSAREAGAELLINLGVDRGVQVRREKLTDKLTETFFGMMDRSAVARELEYRIVVENLKAEAVRVWLFDAVPVSTTDRVQVKGIEITPEPDVADEQDREGVMRWEFELTPGGVQEIRTRFFVKYPRHSPLLGL
ncbi:hypothetical protein DENIS_4408 [Desulfonema ishimotonii]|uniref:Mucoidy inhibitor MuiA family protein n=1 Tax=Desulfonema ishimotonii TaxID=45657 RepID=A0A401G2G5_9BACT|nr:mucoidy inhibitor MuiA family protein [Desulfonema ishimotonii]GBC63414.1 hypothetical protein DENIS_4408 [Desulfonema ishimotonii]